MKPQCCSLRFAIIPLLVAYLAYRAYGILVFIVPVAVVALIMMVFRHLRPKSRYTVETTSIKSLCYGCRGQIATHTIMVSGNRTAVCEDCLKVVTERTALR